MLSGGELACKWVQCEAVCEAVHLGVEHLWNCAAAACTLCSPTPVCILRKLWP